ncbi:hypothetical protein [Lacipirellula sp.]|uniref:hypothetical protein n=1 Tax=Lacipirellula sp. TaxID=2691419 RepID=UPI003D0ED244
MSQTTLRRRPASRPRFIESTQLGEDGLAVAAGAEGPGASEPAPLTLRDRVFSAAAIAVCGMEVNSPRERIEAIRIIVDLIQGDGGESERRAEESLVLDYERRFRESGKLLTDQTSETKQEQNSSTPRGVVKRFVEDGQDAPEAPFDWREAAALHDLQEAERRSWETKLPHSPTDYERRFMEAAELPCC